MSCKHADRITCTININNSQNIQYCHASAKRKAGYYLYAYADKEQGPFRTWDAAKLARTITKGT